MSVYFNNAATSWPKPPCVAQAMKDFLESGGANFARGSAAERDIATMSMTLECRERLARMFGGWENASPQYVTFTSGVTESLNVVLKGFLKPGMTVLTTSMEHNAVTRPLRRLQSLGVKVEIVRCDGFGLWFREECSFHMVHSFYRPLRIFMIPVRSGAPDIPSSHKRAS